MDTRPSRALLIVLLAAALGGCLTSEEANTDKPGNSAPTISNSPDTVIMTGDTYSFRPSASDPDGDTLTFSVTNLPRWANFDSATGKLSGRPVSGDEGIYNNISISVSDGSTKVSLPAFSIEVTQTALGSLTLNWTPPTENEDGTPLNDLAGYKFYYGTTSGHYTRQVRVDNPGVSINFPETWAYGFRNPYRMAFDPAGEGELFVGDAGQELWEEVSIVKAGGNYGWNVREGAHCFSTANPSDPDAIRDCPTEDPEGDPLIDPILEFPNIKHPGGGLGTTIVGGVVYRGDRLPAWDGRYIFGQWSRSFSSPEGGLFVATRSETNAWDFEPVQIVDREDGELGEYLLALGQDSSGEVYVLTSRSAGPSETTGSVYRLSAP